MSSDRSSILVGVGSIVILDGRILLVKRKYPPGRGLWSVPGGHVEPGEDILRAAVRELREETGVTGDPLGVINVDGLVVSGEQPRYYVLVDVLLRYVGGEPRPGGDAVDVMWAGLEWALRSPKVGKSTRGLVAKIMEGLLPLERPIPYNVYSY